MQKRHLVSSMYQEILQQFFMLKGDGCRLDEIAALRRAKSIAEQFFMLEVDGCRLDETASPSRAKSIAEANQLHTDPELGVPQMEAAETALPFELLLQDHSFALQRFEHILTEEHKTTIKLRAQLTRSRALTSSRRLNVAHPPDDHPAEKFAEMLVEQGISTPNQVFAMAESDVRILLDKALNLRDVQKESLVAEWIHASNKHQATGRDGKMESEATLAILSELGTDMAAAQEEVHLKHTAARAELATRLEKRKSRRTKFMDDLRKHGLQGHVADFEQQHYFFNRRFSGC